MKRILLTTFVLLLAMSSASADDKAKLQPFSNPVIEKNAADPTVIKGDDGHFYLYSTGGRRNLPVYRSDNLVNWTFIGQAFGDGDGPTWNPKGNIWAPDVNFINGKYVIYYAKSTWGGEWTCGIGVGISDKPEGPFKDLGPMFISKDIGVRNSIDAFYINDGGKNYLVWGSFHGIYLIQLTDDGLKVMPGANKIQLAGNQMEGSYIFKRKGYYYLFGSEGSCCEGVKSTYRVIFGRSKSLFGPYLTKGGERMLDGKGDVMIKGNDFVAGPGHNAEFIVDDKGKTWIPYHGFLRSNPDKGRVVFLSEVKWKKGWPYVEGGSPARTYDTAPYFKTNKK